MDFPEKSLKVRIPVKAPVSSKPEKEEQQEKKEEEEDRFTTPKGEEFRIPPLFECPLAPEPRIFKKKIEKRRQKAVGQRNISFNVQDLDTFFARTQNVADDS
ncbi:hypothetical protein ISN45_At01g061330 [Arabidopsis thaliana x Arabidopsis arenosa]|jgi:hypothetical protein|uniref:Uncharacterized protein n=4 Tax=Arabidopsis TaxID=3701 RepID=Q56YG9_ARATH|nr:unknown protein [Arabidopsis thaliana]KAG7651253.1 hypothetical protein ISN45_At01g061330 [Arabidopsis thaliana x Arabidopsis arenosa]OAP14057.1 hypothetical protein AXX17_AT1G64750 [Arabidopsis thaliana]BAD94210.1 hypothetical protein [Arabidopsis thaliana]